MLATSSVLSLSLSLVEFCFSIAKKSLLFLKTKLKFVFFQELVHFEILELSVPVSSFYLEKEQGTEGDLLSV